MAKRLPADVLYITKRLPGRYAEMPDNVDLVVIPYWEPGVPESPGPLKEIWIAFGKTLGSIWFLLRSIPAMIRFRPDLVHVHTVLPVVLAAFAKIVLRLPVVMTFHGTDFVWFRKSRPLQWLTDRSADVVLCVSHEMADEMRSLLRRARVIQMNNGVDLALFSDLGMDRRRQIAAVGTLKWQKGYEYLLEAMQLLVPQHPDLQLAIAGAGPLQEELQTRADSMGLENNVRFLGVISHNEVVELLNQSLVFVMSSVSEGFPRALLEALACGIPVVVTSVGECPSVAEGAGYVVPPRSPEALADAIGRLVSDETEWKKYSRQAQARAHEYSWDGVAAQTLAIYRELLRNRKARTAAEVAPRVLPGDEPR